MTSLSTGSSSSNNAGTQSRPLIELLFGNGVSSEWPYSESTLLKALDFKMEQERTKQQYYKLEKLNKSIELLKLAKRVGVPPADISALFNEDEGVDSIKKDISIEDDVSGRLQRISGIVMSNQEHPAPGKQPMSYKFPPAGSNLPPKPISSSLKHKRTNSPARIGAYAVAALNDSISMKEEDDSSNVAMFQSLGTGSAYPETHSHRRNVSLPSTSSVSNTIPHGMRSILSFNSNATGKVSASTSSIRKPSHSRSKSAASHHTIDLDVIENSRNVEPNTPEIIIKQEERPDDKTCSESSSTTDSPIRPAKGSSSINILLNSG